MLKLELVLLKSGWKILYIRWSIWGRKRKKESNINLRFFRLKLKPTLHMCQKQKKKQKTSKLSSLQNEPGWLFGCQRAAPWRSRFHDEGLFCGLLSCQLVAQGKGVWPTLENISVFKIDGRINIASYKDMRVFLLFKYLWMMSFWISLQLFFSINKNLQ